MPFTHSKARSSHEPPANKKQRPSRAKEKPQIPPEQDELLTARLGWPKDDFRWGLYADSGDFS